MVSRLMDLDFTVGALQTAIGISGILLGCSANQTYVYYKNYPHDSPITKYYVALLLILETAQQISAMHAIYTMSVTNWGNVFALLKQPSSISATFFLGIFVPPLVETFYLWRLYKLFGTPRACLFGLLVCWTRFCGWILFAVQETRLGYISGELFDNWTWLLIVLLVTGAILNGTIAGAMLYYLYGQRDTPLMRTKILVDRLIMWTVQTGLITGITYIVVLVVFLTMQDTLVWMAILACTTKVFSNCLLSSLNARPPQIPNSLLRRSPAPSDPTNSEPIIINITREQGVFNNRPITPVRPSSVYSPSLIMHPWQPPNSEYKL